MDDVADLQSRITAALDRIRTGLDRVEAQAAQPEDTPDLSAELEEERTANAQLEERVRALKERQDGTIRDLEARVASQKSQMVELDEAVQRLSAANADLRALTASLREAALQGVAEPELINRATIAELDAVRAQRDADAAEVDAILKELKPLVTEAAHAAN